MCSLAPEKKEMIMLQALQMKIVGITKCWSYCVSPRFSRLMCIIIINITYWFDSYSEESAFARDLVRNLGWVVRRTEREAQADTDVISLDVRQIEKLPTTQHTGAADMHNDVLMVEG